MENKKHTEPLVTAEGIELRYNEAKTEAERTNPEHEKFIVYDIIYTGREQKPETK